jgi:hypothetical protein
MVSYLKTFFRCTSSTVEVLIKFKFSHVRETCTCSLFTLYRQIHFSNLLSGLNFLPVPKMNVGWEPDGLLSVWSLWTSVLKPCAMYGYNSRLPFCNFFAEASICRERLELESCHLLRRRWRHKESRGLSSSVCKRIQYWGFLLPSAVLFFIPRLVLCIFLEILVK